MIQRVGGNALAMGIFSDNISLKSGKMSVEMGEEERGRTIPARAK